MDDLQRFVDAQETSWRTAIAELRAGAKRSHWMWWIFPQIAGLGRSETARFYAIRSAAEAKAYLAHPVLGPRLIEATEAMLTVNGSAEDVLGPIDATKLRSSMTLFEQVAPDASPFRAALERFYAGERDSETLSRL